MIRLSEHGGTAAVDSLHLSLRETGASETGADVGTVEEVALGRGDVTELGASGATDIALCLDSLAKGTELLGVVAVRAEGSVGRGAVRSEAGRKGACRGGGVGLGCVVNLSWDGALANESDHGSPIGVGSGSNSLAKRLGGQHCYGGKRCGFGDVASGDGYIAQKKSVLSFLRAVRGERVFNFDLCRCWCDGTPVGGRRRRE